MTYYVIRVLKVMCTCVNAICNIMDICFPYSLSCKSKVLSGLLF